MARRFIAVYDDGEYVSADLESAAIKDVETQSAMQMAGDFKSPETNLENDKSAET